MQAKDAIVDILGSGKKALFISEIAASLRRSGIGKEELDQAITELAAVGSIMVRDHFCADPHLEYVDLRVAALVENQSDADGHAVALHEIDLAWNRWLGEFLANHRCG